MGSSPSKRAQGVTVIVNSEKTKQDEIQELKNLQSEINKLTTKKQNMINAINERRYKGKNTIGVPTDIHSSMNKEITNPKADELLMDLEKIDLISFLGARVYEAEVTNELCDFQNIISLIKTGFESLKCHHDHWDNKAIICLKYEKDTSVKLFCNFHSELVDKSNKRCVDLESKQKKIISLLETIEKLLIVIEVQMKYFQIKDDNIFMNNYASLKERVDEEYSSLKTVLSQIAAQTSKIKINKNEKVKELKYEKLKLLYSDFKICKRNMINLLNLLHEADMDSQMHSKFRAIVNWSRGADENWEEEKKTDEYSVFNKIYGNKIELCMVPTQTLKKLKQLEEKIKEMAKVRIT